MTGYPEGFRARMVERMSGPRAGSATALSQEVGIRQPTLSRWLREAGSVGRKQLRASIHCAHQFLRDVLDGRMEADDPVRAAMKLSERVFRFATRDRKAKELFRTHGVDPADVLLDDERLP